MPYSSLLPTYMKLTNEIQKQEFEFDFYNTLFLDTDCSEHHDTCNCAWEHFQRAEQARAMLKILNDKKDQMNAEYDLKKTSSYLTYGLTIGSAEKDNTEPCLYLWNKFINSADGKRCNDVEAFFEKGDNGYIHIHAIFTRQTKFSRSINELRKRFGKYKGKQHNFDPIRLKGIDIVKWKNYIRKDSQKLWNKTVNPLISNNSLKNKESRRD